MRRSTREVPTRPSCRPPTGRHQDSRPGPHSWSPPPLPEPPVGARTGTARPIGASTVMAPPPVRPTAGGGGGGPPTTCAVCSEARRRLAWSDKAAAVVREGPADTWKARCTEALVPETGSASRQHSRPAAQTQRTAWKELVSYLGSALRPGSLRFSPVMRTVLALPSAGARDVFP